MTDEEKSVKAAQAIIHDYLLHYSLPHQPASENHLRDCIEMHMEAALAAARADEREKVYKHVIAAVELMAAADRHRAISAEGKT